MKEIRARGPVVGSFEPTFDFSYYHSGIYHSHSYFKKGKGDPSSKTIRDNGEVWEKVDHSIVLVGWGIQDGVKYWIC